MQNVNDDRYYGSDLNRFIDENCSRQMTCINIDTLLVKIAKKKIRIIESKHSNEHMPNSQLTALKILSQQTTNQNGWTVEYYIIRGDPPYKDVFIHDLIKNENVTMKQQEFIGWLNFENQGDII